MGSPITTKRAVAGIRTHDGRKLFVLFEETYSSNTRPHTPEWCCMGFDYLPATMQRIFDFASCCEGGMLRSRSGRLTPEGYIETWLKERHYVSPATTPPARASPVPAKIPAWNTSTSSTA